MSDEHSEPIDQPVGEERLTSNGFVPLAPQTIGDTEARFIAAIKAELSVDPSVLRAYLAICSINGAAPEVALCLAFAGDLNEDSILRCQKVFYGMFNRAESLVVVPLDEEREQTLRAANVAPFFSQGTFLQ